jgi:hypothetical protein
MISQFLGTRFGTAGQAPVGICDYCGSSYRGWAIKDGEYRYCTGLCSERGKVLLARLEQLPKIDIDSFISRAHGAPCATCGRKGSIDASSRIEFGRL